MSFGKRFVKHVALHSLRPFIALLWLASLPLALVVGLIFLIAAGLQDHVEKEQKRHGDVPNWVLRGCNIAVNVIGDLLSPVGWGLEFWAGGPKPKKS